MKVLLVAGGLHVVASKDFTRTQQACLGSAPIGAHDTAVRNTILLPHAESESPLPPSFSLVCNPLADAAVTTHAPLPANIRHVLSAPPVFNQQGYGDDFVLVHELGTDLGCNPGACAA